MHKLLTLAILLGFTAACETTKSHELSPTEIVNINHCAKGVPEACIEASLDAMTARQFGAADKFAEEACMLGNAQGCRLAQDLMRHPARNRGSRVVNNDAALINLLNESAAQMGTVGGRKAGDPAPTRTRCVSQWNSFMKQEETVCEQD